MGIEPCCKGVTWGLPQHHGNNMLAQNGADNNDRYEAWCHEFTSSSNTTPDYGVCATMMSRLVQIWRPLVKKSRNLLHWPLQINQLAQVSDTPVKPQRPIAHAFASTNFFPSHDVQTSTTLNINHQSHLPLCHPLFPILGHQPIFLDFCYLTQQLSSTSSFTHEVFSAEPIPCGSYIASIKGSITSVQKYTEDVYNQYASLGCNKPYVKFFKSIRLEDPFLCDQDVVQINNRLVIDSRQYAPCLHDLELPNNLIYFRIVLIIQTIYVLLLASCFSFGIFAASDTSHCEEIILPWEWDDQHLKQEKSNFVSRLHSVSSLVTEQSWLLSCKLAAVTLTFFGLLIRGCEQKRSCAINLMWKIVFLSAGQPIFQTNKDGTANSEACKMSSIFNLNERQEIYLPLTFEEQLQIALNLFLGQLYHLPSKIGQNAHPNISTPNTGGVIQQLTNLRLNHPGLQRPLQRNQNNQEAEVSSTVNPQCTRFASRQLNQSHQGFISPGPSLMRFKYPSIKVKSDGAYLFTTTTFIAARTSA
ncbi:uncharacterized protein VP01_2835g6 [Puccinia sorghi]|uniref:Uncharacterized protein n=1 Tax=Puccinia sorghi TaxID=27349 RepID=A0A0L6V270_9BASI|nr:uncharacterized protein VP01_2835g6 [Puccinia sorghi]